MLYTELGPRMYAQGSAVATLSLSPPSDRAAIIRRILIDKPSATDTWVLSCKGREVGRYYIATTGTQQLLGGPQSGYPKDNDVFEIVDAYFPDTLIYPVPNGFTFTCASVGGATANVGFVYTEHTNDEVNPSLLNHPEGHRWIAPIYGYRAANVTAAGGVAFDTEIKPSWWPNFWIDGDFPPSQSARMLCMFLEGGGRNTYNGSADHQSVTSYLSLIKNGVHMFTRADAGGIPLIGQASATGSANTVVGNDFAPIPAFQEADVFDFNVWPQGLMLSSGDLYQWRLGITGDVTGGATYASMVQVMLVDFRSVGGA